MTAPTVPAMFNPGAAHAAAPVLDDAEFELFRKLIYEAAGIHLSPAKRALVAGRLSKRLRELGHASYRDYFNWLNRDTGDESVRRERQMAIDLLTTNETYFFREERHFQLVREQLFPAWVRRSIRMWSAACSTGEEAYTLAMIAAMHFGGPWEIVGTDISSRVVETARQGIYPMQRSEKIPKSYLQACCLKGIGSQAGRFQIEPSLRRRVKFFRSNLLESQSSHGLFDLIMLRNVLIYFEPDVKARVVSNVVRQLRPGGWLMVGHAESLNGLAPGLVTVQPSVYRKDGVG
jgi:chemotaxis protein methyltransferase CheR